mmetsp:Transcript_20124/g.34683  ORF Transcript_20124/g.34683 Transcript_20124/m.34683 type:complete len:228 (-) Transcript_20124:287-970(-)
MTMFQDQEKRKSPRSLIGFGCLVSCNPVLYTKNKSYNNSKTQLGDTIVCRSSFVVPMYRYTKCLRYTNRIHNLISGGGRGGILYGAGSVRYGVSTLRCSSKLYASSSSSSSSQDYKPGSAQFLHQRAHHKHDDSGSLDSHDHDHDHDHPCDLELAARHTDDVYIDVLGLCSEGHDDDDDDHDHDNDNDSHSDNHALSSANEEIHDDHHPSREQQDPAPVAPSGVDLV